MPLLLLDSGVSQAPDEAAQGTVSPSDAWEPACDDFERLLDEQEALLSRDLHAFVRVKLAEQKRVLLERLAQAQDLCDGSGQAEYARPSRTSMARGSPSARAPSLRLPAAADASEGSRSLEAEEQAVGSMDTWSSLKNATRRLFAPEAPADDADKLLQQLRDRREESKPPLSKRCASKVSQMTGTPSSSDPLSSSRTSRKEYRSAALRELAGQEFNAAERWVVRMVNSNRFESLCGCVILACAAAMAVGIQFDGQDLGKKYGLPGYEDTDSSAWHVLNHALDIVFAVLFTMELLFRIFALGWRAWHSSWTWLDMVLVVCAWLDEFDMLRFETVDPMVLRVARLARLLRLLKVLKASKVFETLFLLVRSVQVSLGALVWSFATILFVQFCAAILLCQILADYVDNDDEDIEIRLKVHSYFGTFAHGMVTMFEVVMGNWMALTRFFYENVGPAYGLFFIIYRGCFIFAMEKVIIAVFLAETTRCLNNDDNISIVKAQRQKEAYCRKLQAIFEELDDSGDGVLDFEEFAQLMSNDLLRTWLATLNVDTQDIQDLFEILAGGDGKLDINEFTYGMTRVKGPAKSIDVLKIQSLVGRISLRLDDMERVMTAQRTEQPRPKVCEATALGHVRQLPEPVAIAHKPLVQVVEEVLDERIPQPRQPPYGGQGSVVTPKKKL